MLSLFILQTFFSVCPDCISINTRKRTELIELDREQFAECESYTSCTQACEIESLPQDD